MTEIQHGLVAIKARKIVTLVHELKALICPSAYAKSRDCITAIKLDILHNIEPTRRPGFDRLIKAFKARKIFTEDMLVELDVRIDFLERETGKCTTKHERHDEYDECNVSGSRSWTQKRMTRKTTELGCAVIMLLELYDT